MSGTGLPNLARPLIHFVQRLGLQQSSWSKHETTDVISVVIKVPNKSAAALTPADFDALKQAYGSALKTLSFAAEDEPGALPALELSEQIDEPRLESFRAEIARFDPYLTFLLDKNALIQQLFPGLPSYCRILLYFFPEALVSLLSNRFDDLEDQLWPTDDPCKAILLVPSSEILLEGDYLAAVGGSHLDTLPNIIPVSPPDVSTTKSMFGYCREHLLWRKDWVDRLTPLHFKVTISDPGSGSGSGPGNGSIGQILQIHLATLVLLYTAQLTSEAKGHLVSTYAGSQYSANIIIPTVEEAITKRLPQTGEHLLNIVDAVYDPVWLERGRGLLPIVQSVVSERLQPTPPEDAFEVFIGFAETLESSIELQWQSVFENKLTAYFAQVKTIEEYIASTVSSISQQIIDMIKGLSDTMLTAVAAIVGTFIAALFNDKFNAVLFSFGMMVYGTYVLAFPLIYNMSARRGNYRALLGDYQKRRDNFKAQIADDRISTIEGTRIQDRKRSFTKWFWITVSTYLIIVGIVFFAAVSALDPNGFIASIGTSSNATPTPSPTLTVVPRSATLTVAPTSVPNLLPSPAPTLTSTHP